MRISGALQRTTSPFIAALLAASGLATACSNSPATGTRCGESSLSRDCRCPDGRQGFQDCDEAGRYGECECYVADVGVFDASILDTISGESDVADEVDPHCGDGFDRLGCPCIEDDDCGAAYCVQRGSDDFVCSRFCAGDDDECAHDEFEFSCRVVENSGGDAVRICLPSTVEHCQPCPTGSCATLGSMCVDLPDGPHCLRSCDPRQGQCPPGSECSSLDGRMLCVPEGDVCSDCWDPDSDGRGIGPSCLGADCGPDDPTVYEDAAELCDGKDNDCDRAIDEGLPDNGCGGCSPLEDDPGATCGTCGAGVLTCTAPEAIECVGDEAVRNACGGCSPLDGVLGASCGECGGGTLACDGAEDLICLDATSPCGEASCANGVRDADESGVDCGDTCGVDCAAENWDHWHRPNACAGPNRATALSVALTGDILVVGASDAAYIYEWSGTSWVEMRFVEGEPGSALGAAVATDGNLVVIGAPDDDTAGTNAGAAVVLRRDDGWASEVRLAAPAPKSESNFGHAVAADPQTLMIGAPSEDDRGVDRGAVYAYSHRSGEEWSVSPRRIIDPSGLNGALFGYALDVDGEVAAVGAPGQWDVAASAGAVHVLSRSDGEWTYEAALPSTGLGAGDRLGDAVAVHGARVVAGAPGSSESPTGPGFVQTFRRTGATWEQEDSLAPGRDGRAGDLFGSSVAVGPDIVLVGAPGNADAGDATGSLYLYRDSVSGTAESEILPLPGAVNFGARIDYSGNRIAVADPAYVHPERAARGTAWVLDSETPAVEGCANGVFDWGEEDIDCGGPCRPCLDRWTTVSRIDVAGASSLAANHEHVFVGARLASLEGYQVGEVRFYGRIAGTWEEAGVLHGETPSAHFGDDVAVDGNVLVVAASGALVENRVGDLEPYGAAFVFVWTGTRWILDGTLSPSPPNSYEGFGRDVAIDGSTVVVSEMNPSSVGRAYAYSLDSGEWNQSREFATGSRYDGFSRAVAVAEDGIFVGAPCTQVGCRGVATVWTASAESESGEMDSRFTGPDGFGSSVAASDELLAIGTRHSSTPSEAVVYRRADDGWTEQLVEERMTGGRQVTELAVGPGLVAIGVEPRCCTSSPPPGSLVFHEWDTCGWEGERHELFDEGGSEDFADKVAATNGRIVVATGESVHVIEECPASLHGPRCQYSCENGVQDGEESGIDCGALCSPCG